MRHFRDALMKTYTRGAFLAGVLAFSSVSLLGARKRSVACPRGQTVGQMLSLIVRDIANCSVGGMR